VRARALRHLVSDDSVEAFDLLAGILRGDEDAAVKSQAVMALAYQGGARAERLLQEVVSDPDLNVALRVRAAQGLVHASPVDAPDFLRDLFMRVSEPELQETIIMGIGHQDDAATREWLEELVRQPGLAPGVRERAFVWLGRDERIATTELIEIYERFPPGEGRHQAIYVIAMRNDDAVCDFMLRLAREGSDPALRRVAVVWLGELDDPRALQLFEELLTQ
jgi:HEAT repeat protein